MIPATSDRTGALDFTRADDSTCQCVVIAPIASTLPSSLIPESPGTLRRSTRCLGWARRSFIIGMRLWPPATIFASSLNWPRSPRASLTLVGAWYSNAAGYMVLSLCLGAAGAALDRLPHALRGERHDLDVIDSERGQRINHRVDDGRRRRDRAGLARALDAERVHRRRRHRAVGLVHRQHV